MDMIVSIVKATTFYNPNKKLLGELATKVRKIRKSKNLTIEQFSELCGLHSKYLQTIERGTRNISISVFVQIATALNISPSKLLAKITK
jgi:transcriptional regulator with XRE-family HTH domain